MNRSIIAALLLVFVAVAPLSAQEEESKVNVVATLPDIGSITKSIGGDEVEVTNLARGWEDPHFVIPTPALMAAVSRADLYLEIGLSLEIWTERVLDGARNPRVRIGAPGHQYVSVGVRPLQVPRIITRAQGDLHPEGNPHIWLDPLNGIVMAQNIRDALIRAAPERKAVFEKGYEGFAAKTYEKLYGKELVSLLGGPLLAKLDRAGSLMKFLEKKKLEGRPLLSRLGGFHKKAQAFRGKKVIFYHRSWVYFANRFGIEICNYVEDKPGVPPNARHRDALIKLVKDEQIPVVAMTSYYPKRVPEAIAEATGVKLVLLPNSTLGEKAATDYLTFLDIVVSRLEEAYGE